MQQKVIMVGCGWLGQQLGIALATAGFEVYGTRQSSAAAAQLPALIRPLVLQLPLDTLPVEQQAIWQDAWLVCAIPPAVRQFGPAHYPMLLENLAFLARESSCRGVFHCSSTGVYEGLTGDVTEDSALDLTTKAAYLVAGETSLRAIQPCITLRLAGLIGPGRHPGAFGRHGSMTGADEPVNLVHSADVAAFIIAILHSAAIRSDCVNLSSPVRLCKKDFYPLAAAQLGLPAPVIQTSNSPGRCVRSLRVAQYPQFHYRYPSALDALSDCC